MEQYRQLVVEIEEEADSIEDILSGTELVLGPALDGETFPAGAPADRDKRVRALLAIDDPDDADELVALIFPDGVPADVDASDVLRALREAAHREHEALHAASDELSDRARRVVGLWAIATARHAAAARSVDALAAVLMEALAARWRELADSVSSTEVA